MHTLEFETEYRYPDHPTAGIVLDVQLHASSNKFVTVQAHVDTGASYCLFMSEYADLLGLELRDGEPKEFNTPNGGKIKAYGHNLTIKVLNHEVDSMVYFADDPLFKRNVLGRQGWLHHFRLGLIHYESKLYLKRY